nr:GerMN domain-containing protein [Micromonospora sp. DSM 115978]
MTGPDHRDEDLLRRALRAEADKIEVRPDALAAIQERIRDRRPAGVRAWWSALLPGRMRAAGSARPAVPGDGVRGGGSAGSAAPGDRGRRTGRAWRGWAPAATGAVTLATALVAAVVIGVVGVPGSAPIPPGGQEGSGERPSPTGSAAVAVYYLGRPAVYPDQPAATRDQPAALRLYREFYRLDVGDGSAGDRVATAVRRMLDPRGPDDPDYSSGWPTGTRLRGASVSQGVATVDLAGAGTNGVPAATARQAVQQLIWTVTAVDGVDGVRVQLDGSAVDRLWDTVDVRGVQRRGPAVDVLAPVWLVAPQHGVTVGRDVAVHVAGIVAEATVHLRVRQGARTVEERALTLSAGRPAQGEARLTVRLPPGDYVLQAYTISAADGTELHIDDHTIEVR